MGHFTKLQTPLGAVQKYPTALTQAGRFISLGWTNASARNLWELWSSHDFITAKERTELDDVEPFDEWEEFALFGCHYVLAVANNLKAVDTPDPQPQTLSNTHSSLESSFTAVYSEAGFSPYPKLNGYRRFASPMALRGPPRIPERIGNFGGMSLNSRSATYDIYTPKSTGLLPSFKSNTTEAPKSRMCHTMTDMGEAGSLLVGGRSSPDQALTDCWVYHKWLGMWERIDDLPQPRYRHCAVFLGGFVLVTPGRRDSKTISDEYLLWSRHTGWVQCTYDVMNYPDPAYGATFAVFDQATNGDSHLAGIIAGGITRDGVVSNGVWLWQLDIRSPDVRIPIFPSCQAFISYNSRLLCSQDGCICTGTFKLMIC